MAPISIFTMEYDEEKFILFQQNKQANKQKIK